MPLTDSNQLRIYRNQSEWLQQRPSLYATQQQFIFSTNLIFFHRFFSMAYINLQVDAVIFNYKSLDTYIILCEVLSNGIIMFDLFLFDLFLFTKLGFLMWRDFYQLSMKLSTLRVESKLWQIRRYWLNFPFYFEFHIKFLKSFFLQFFRYFLQFSLFFYRNLLLEWKNANEIFFSNRDTCTANCW